MDWKETIRAIAPTIGTALLGPLGGVAVSAIGSILGVSEPTQEKIAAVIADGRLTPEMIARLKEKEMEFAADEKRLGFSYAELAFKEKELDFKDRDSARARESATKDETNRRLAFLIILSFLATCILMFFGVAKVDSVIAGTVLGYLSAKAEQVLAYYFGSTSSSERKTELIAKAGPVTNG